jgi:GNAT superfamily N-acetyltransferase
VTDYRYSIEQGDMQVESIHAFLSTSYWAAGISRDVVARAIRGSVCIGAFDGGAQIGFARVVSDRATFAYLADVYVLEAHRGRGIARTMVEQLQALPDLQGLRRWMLMTRDAHTLYETLGWSRVTDPTRTMQRHFPDVYGAATT